MSQVYIARCPDYTTQHVERALRESLQTLADAEPLILAGQQVVLKPNLLQARPPEDAITTHPAIVAAVARWVSQAGATPIIADSPGGLLNARKLRRLYRVTGMEQAARESGALLNYDVRGVSIPCPAGRASKTYDGMRAMVCADAIISLPKLKTHGLLRFTGAVKNLFGTVPGVLKGTYHARFPTVDRFSAMLIDILNHYRPTLTVMDAVTGMEGDGPSGGEPRPLGLLLVSTDPVALDVVATSIIGMVPLTVPTIAAACRRGLTTGQVEDITVLGESLEAARITGFKHPRTGSSWARMIPSAVPSWIVNRLLASPEATAACTACGTCVENCPSGAVAIVEGRARTDLGRCTRCYCCHELCPEDAVALHLPPLARLLAR